MRYLPMQSYRSGPADETFDLQGSWLFVKETLSSDDFEFFLEYLGGCSSTALRKYLGVAKTTMINWLEFGKIKYISIKKGRIKNWIPASEILRVLVVRKNYERTTVFADQEGVNYKRFLFNAQDGWIGQPTVDTFGAQVVHKVYHYGFKQFYKEVQQRKREVWWEQRNAHLLEKDELFVTTLARALGLSKQTVIFWTDQKDFMLRCRTVGQTRIVRKGEIRSFLMALIRERFTVQASVKEKLANADLRAIFEEGGFMREFREWRVKQQAPAI